MAWSVVTIGRGDHKNLEGTHMPCFKARRRTIAAVMIATIPTTSFAHDPRTHRADGLASARSKDGELCCNGKDYNIAESWHAAANGFYVVWSRGNPLIVSPETILRNVRNNDSQAKGWFIWQLGFPIVRCFLTGPES